MPDVVVCDANILIHLQKGRILDAFGCLPHDCYIPGTIREDELSDFTASEWRVLDGSGMTTCELSDGHIRQAENLERKHTALSIYDCIVMTMAESHAGSVLLTGDDRLRKVAEARGLEVHGVLWIIDQPSMLEAFRSARLVDVLEVWRDDATVYLPDAEIERRITALKSGAASKQ